MAIIYDEIRTLIDAPAGTDAPTLAAIEDTLTAGYARALELEAERMRLERRLSEIAVQLHSASADGANEEIVEVGERLSATDGDLTRLRALLGRLRDRARGVRAAS
jgi:type II secretory pathway component PulM